MSEYFKTIGDGVTTVLGGMKITWEHMINAANRKGTAGIADENYFNQIEGLATLQYPSEVIPTPSFARYRLHNEADDCIACDQCARACPVNCITIDSFKVTPDDLEEAGSTADGTKKKLWLPVFDIDMAKCMYCGLCTYPCPTECITMTPVHDFSEFDRSNFIYYFGNMTPEAEAEKREKLAKFELEKAAEKARVAAAPKPAVAASTATAVAPAAGAKMSPMMAAKLAAQKKAEGAAATAATDEVASAAAPQPVAPAANQAEATADAAKDAGAAKPLPKLSPMMAKLAAAKAAGGGAAAAPVAKVVEPTPSEPAPLESVPQPEAEKTQPENQDDDNSEPPAASMPASGVSTDVDVVTKPADEVKPAADNSAAKTVATVPVTSKPKPVTLEIRKVEPKQTEVKMPAVRVPEIRLPEIKVENILSGVTTLVTGALYVGAGLAMALTLGLFKAITTPSEPRRADTDPTK
ncbi:MAG: 4Fe-4S dicluster domain-containing protein [Rhizobacter sp.]|nr:4Fe-4S dicluster domain-containing protein [Chlorobiales bacterium]